MKDLTNRKGEESHLSFLVQFSMGIVGTCIYHFITYLSIAFSLFMSISFLFVECLLYARPKNPGMFSQFTEMPSRAVLLFLFTDESLRHSEMQQTSYISKMECVIREPTDEARETEFLS